MTRAAFLGMVFALGATAAQGHAHYFPFDPEGSAATVAVAVNATKNTTGFYLDSDAVAHGFVRDHKGAIASFDPAGSEGTYPTAIGDDGAITGYFDKDGTEHAFLRDVQGAIFTFDFAGVKDTRPSAINMSGTIVGTVLKRK